VTVPVIRIDFDSDGFPPGGPVANGPGTLVTSWDEVLWAAVTVGRPNRQYVFRHGMASMYEALFRWSLVRMALEQTRPSATRLRRTTAARTLDPSEKGAVNYFLGLAICKLFAARFLNAPWLLHLDVFRPALNVALTGRSRPDLIGQTSAGLWVALECKGRVSAPDDPAKQRAKTQAQRVVTVNGAQPVFHVGGIAYFRNDVLRFFWRDPVPDSQAVKKPIAIDVRADDWRHYYSPAFELIRSRPEYFQRMLREPILMPVETVDIKIGIHPHILTSLAASHPEQVRTGPEAFTHDGQHIYRADGVAVVAGESWLQPFDEG